MTEQTIVGFAGKKQAGKNTSYSCIRLWRPEAQDFSFADALKRTCVDVLGLEEWQAYGTDEQKNTCVPHLLWENFPVKVWDKEDGGVFVGEPNHQRWKITNQADIIEPCCGDGIPLKTPITVSFAETAPDLPIYDGIALPLPAYNSGEDWNEGVHLIRKSGQMTAREVLQYWGTEIFRAAYPQVWADACIRKIRKSGCTLAVITDCRFPNEVEAIQQAGGRVVRLTKVVFPDDTHPSEIALDPEHFDQNRFDAVLDNAQSSVNEQCEMLYSLLRRWGVVGGKKVNRMHI